MTSTANALASGQAPPFDAAQCVETLTAWVRTPAPAADAEVLRARTAATYFGYCTVRTAVVSA